MEENTREYMVEISHVSKQYRLGQIGGTTLRDELQRRRAKRRNQEDPTRKIGAVSYSSNVFLALNDVSFKVKKGERVGIIGHNGAGKSTLLKLISRVTAPSSGEIGMNGHVASMLEVGTGFHAELTGRENVYVNGAILGMTKKEIDAKMEEIIEFSECRQFIDTPVKRYSSGMYVKLAFSVAAHLDSEIMIMDEVLAVGDMAFQKKCLDKMSEVSKNEGRTILYVSHNMNTIKELCDRCIVLDHGRVVFDGGVDEGIEIYSGIDSDSLGVDIDLSQKRMPHLRNLETGAKMSRIQLNNKIDPTYEIDEDITFKLSINATRYIENPGFRIEIRDTKGSFVGTTVINNLPRLKIGDITLSIVFPSPHLVPGTYKALLVLYDRNDNDIYTACGYEDLDAAFPGFIFSVVDTKKKMPMQYELSWGHIVFDQMYLADSI